MSAILWVSSFSVLGETVRYLHTLQHWVGTQFEEAAWTPLMALLALEGISNELIARAPKSELQVPCYPKVRDVKSQGGMILVTSGREFGRTEWVQWSTETEGPLGQVQDWVALTWRREVFLEGLLHKSGPGVISHFGNVVAGPALEQLEQLPGHPVSPGSPVAVLQLGSEGCVGVDFKTRRVQGSEGTPVLLLRVPRKTSQAFAIVFTTGATTGSIGRTVRVIGLSVTRDEQDELTFGPYHLNVDLTPELVFAHCEQHYRDAQLGVIRN